MRFKKKFGITAMFLSAMIFSSCDFETLFEPSFNEPVKDFFETYTNTAAIEQHNLSVESYQDSARHLCINSDELCTVQFYMRNPQRYNLQPSVKFNSLVNIDTSLVEITQTDTSTIVLTLPQTFLTDSDRGCDISPTISLYEPLSGRMFTDYSFSLSCNSKPPVLNNPTVMNDSGSTFVIAFDMPSQAELALRHTDLASITINGNTYPIEMTGDGSFNFPGTGFTTEQKSFTAISGKTFEYSDRSVYFTTGEPFVEGDKEYTITLTDLAGLQTETLASTKITKLNKPAITNPAGKSVESNYEKDYNAQTKEYTPKSLPLVSGGSVAKVTITAPTTDNLGNEVDASGLAVHYTLYNGTPKAAKLVKSGTFAGSMTLDLEVGSWYLETYATKTNYENSAKAISYIRVLDSCLFVSASGSDDDTEADGSEALPFGTIGKAIADINSRNDGNVEYTLLIMGGIDGEDNTVTGIAASGLIIEGVTSAAADSIGSLSLACSLPVKFKGITVTSLTAQSQNNFILTEGAVISDAVISSGATIYIEENALIGEAKLAGSGMLTINGNLSQATAATIVPASYTIGSQVLVNNAYLATNYTKFAVKQNNTDTVWSIRPDGTITETADRSIDISVIQQEEDLEVTQTKAGSIITFTETKLSAKGGSYSAEWTLEGATQTTSALNILSLDTTGWIKGIYDLYLEVMYEGAKYSYQAQITVE